MVHDLQIRAPYLKREEGAVAKKCSNVPTGFTLSVKQTTAPTYISPSRKIATKRQKQITTELFIYFKPNSKIAIKSFFKSRVHIAVLFIIDCHSNLACRPLTPVNSSNHFQNILNLVHIIPVIYLSAVLVS